MQMFYQSWVSCFTCQVLERHRLQKRLLSCPRALESDVEPSEESDTVPECDEEPKADKDTASPSAGKEEPVKEQDLQVQVRVWHKWMFLPETLGNNPLAHIICNTCILLKKNVA